MKPQDNVITMPAAEQSEGKSQRSIPPTQAAVDALPFDSGVWRIEGTMGLYVRCRKASKSYFVQRKVQGRVLHKMIGQVSLAEARRQAQKLWRDLRPRPAEARLTLAEAWEQYVEERPLAEKTRFLYRYSLDRYLTEWKKLPLAKVGEDRAGVRRLFLKLRRENGDALASLVMRQLRAVYQYWRRVDPSLPETPTQAVDIPIARPRDWAYSPDELRSWWTAVQRLTPTKRVLWEVLLLTGARRGSVEALTWDDIDFDAGLIHFRTAKAGRTYSIPACRRLLDILKRWREFCPPTEAGWVFPSPFKVGEHITEARDDKRGVGGAHHLRHTYRTMLAELGCPPDSARLLLGHSLSGDVSRGYITRRLVVDSLRPWAEQVAERYAAILGWE
jgi:integrase